QAHGEPRQGFGNRDGGGGIERAALEQDAHDGHADGDQRGGGGEGEGHREEQGLALAGPRFGFPPRGQMPGQLGQEHRADGDADDAERELVEPVGIGDDGDRLIGLRRDDGAHEDVDLDDAARRDGRQRQEPEFLYVLIVAGPGDGGRETGALDGPPDQRQLGDAPRHGGDAQPESDIGGVFDGQDRQRDENGDV